MKEEKTFIWTLIPATLFLLLGLACINEGDFRATLVAFILSSVCFTATYILRKTREEPIKNTYIPRGNVSKKNKYYEGEVYEWNLPSGFTCPFALEFLQGYKEGPDKVSRVPRFVNEDGSPIVESKRSPKPRVNKVVEKPRRTRKNKEDGGNSWSLVIIFIIIVYMLRQFVTMGDSTY